MYNISVIVPVYNAEKWIDNMIYSLINQTIFEKLEIILIDDGSTDNSLDKIKKFEKKYQNIVVFSKKNGGVSSARNLGIEKSSSKFICFIDSDDYVDSNYFEKLYRYHSFDVVATGFIAEYSNGEKVKKCKNNEFKLNSNIDIIKNFILGKVETNCTDKLFNRDIINDLRFNEKLTHGEDKLFVYEYLKKCSSYYELPFAGYHYNIHNESAVRRKFNPNVFRVLDLMNFIGKDVEVNYPELYNFFTSCLIDTKCRIVSELYYFKVTSSYKDILNDLEKDIKKYSIINKYKYSNRKHFFAFILLRINPKVYLFVKNKLKMQYKG